MSFIKYINNFLFIILLSCTGKTNKSNLDSNLNSKLYSYPDKISFKDHPDHKRIFIVSTSDLNGEIRPQTENFYDDNSPELQKINLGGAEYLARYFEIIRSTLPEQTLFLNTGSLLGLTHNLDYSKINYLHHFFELLNYDATSIGVNDFTSALPKNFNNHSIFLKEEIKKSKIPVIVSNLFDLKTSNHIDWKNTYPHLIKKINNINVGVINILPEEMIDQTPVQNRVGLYVEKVIPAILKTARYVRSKGAQVVIMMTDSAILCGELASQKQKVSLSKVNFDPHNEEICDLNSSLAKHLKRLPMGLIDLIITSNNKSKTANMINGIPVINDFGLGKSFSMVEMYFNIKDQAVNQELTHIYQPTLICHEFFEKSQDCFTENTSIDHSKRTPAYFWGEIIEPNQKIKKHFDGLVIERKIFSQQIFNKIIIEDKNSDLFYLPSSKIDSYLVQLKLGGDDINNAILNDLGDDKINAWMRSTLNLKLINGLDLKKQIINDESYILTTHLDALNSNQYLKKFVANKILNQSLHSSLSEIKKQSLVDSLSILQSTYRQ